MAFPGGQPFFRGLIIHKGFFGLRGGLFPSENHQITPLNLSLKREKRKKEEFPTNLVDPKLLSDLQIAATRSTGHNI
jgi:hypothetical protein